MGFDLYGVNPKIKAGSKKPTEVDFQKASNAELKKYFEAERKYRHANMGIYFRNNVWWWRPLANLVEHLCFFLNDKQKSHLHSNDGYEYDEATALKIAKTLEEFVKSDVAKRTEAKHKEMMAKATAHNKKVDLKMKALKMDAIAQTGNKEIAPRDYPKALNKKWDKIYKEYDNGAHYPFEVKNVKEFIQFLRQCGGFTVC